MLELCSARPSDDFRDSNENAQDGKQPISDLDKALPSLVEWLTGQVDSCELDHNAAQFLFHGLLNLLYFELACLRAYVQVDILSPNQDGMKFTSRF